MVCQMPNSRPNRGTGMSRNILIAKQKGNFMASQTIFGLPKQVLMVPTPIILLFHALLLLVVTQVRQCL